LISLTEDENLNPQTRTQDEHHPTTITQTLQNLRDEHYITKIEAIFKS